MTNDEARMRVLARTGRAIARVIWDLGRAVENVKEIRGEWFYVRSGTEDLSGVRRVIEGGMLVVGVTAAELLERRGAALEERLAAIGVQRCEAVMLEEASPGEIKAGGPFHRLSQLRERGVVQSCYIDAPDYATAEWMLNHTPAHAICLPFGLADLSAKYRLIEEAIKFGTGIIARPVETSTWEVAADRVLDLSFVAGEEGISSILLPVTRAAEARRVLESPMPNEERQKWWQRYQQAVPPPPLPTRNLPPEFS